MEPGDSSHSLMSGRHSEMGSRYVMESGVYMSTFAATIFVAALATIGVLLLTLLVALTVMLGSCQDKNSGVIEQVKTSEQYDYCNILAFHADLNNLNANELPTICERQYITGGRFLQDLNLTVLMAESYFSTQTPNDDGLDVILMDLDDLFLSDVINNSNPAQHRYMILQRHILGYDLVLLRLFSYLDLYVRRKQVEDMKHLAHMLVLRLYMKLQASGWSLILLTRKPTRDSNGTVQSLASAGYGGWSSLIMRSDGELLMESWEYISGRRLQLCSQGFRIVSVISSRMDALAGPCLGKRNFKLASLVYLSQV